MTTISNGGFPPDRNGREVNSADGEPSPKIQRSESGINLIVSDVREITADLIVQELRDLDLELRDMLETQEAFNSQNKSDILAKLALGDMINNDIVENEAQMLALVVEYIIKINQSQKFFLKKQIPINLSQDLKQSSLNSEYDTENDFDWEQFLKEMQHHFEVVFSVYGLPPVFSTQSRLNFSKDVFSRNLLDQKNNILKAFQELTGIIERLRSQIITKGVRSKLDLEMLDEANNDIMFYYIAGDADLVKETLDYYLINKTQESESFTAFIKSIERTAKFLVRQKTRIRTALILANTGHISNINQSREFLAEIRFWRSRIEAEKRQFHVKDSQNILFRNYKNLKLLHNKIKNGLFYHFLDNNNLSEIILPQDKVVSSDFDAILLKIQDIIREFNTKRQYIGSGAVTIIVDPASLKNWTIEGEVMKCQSSIEVFKQFYNQLLEQVCRINLTDSQDNFISLVLTQNNIYLEFGLRSDFDKRISIEITFFDEYIDYFLQILRRTEFNFSKFNSTDVKLPESQMI